MISVRHRFHGHNSVQGVYKRGQTVRGQYVNLKFAARRPDQAYRAAVVVSRKVHKSAVVRNRIRRRIYEIIRQADEQLLAHQDLVFTVFSEQVATLDHPRLAAMVTDLLQKAAEKGHKHRSETPGHGIVDKRPGDSDKSAYPS
jgi:ribonuclease P protein component